jgi:polynucleotide 5'-kinase involved in rRNA processing
MDTPGSWLRIVTELRQNNTYFCVYVTGSCDTGKTTLAGYLRKQMEGSFRVGYLDCDPGQTSTGPPTTIGLELSPEASRHGRRAYLLFAGSTTPSANLLQNLGAIKRLEEKAREEGVERLIVDSSGFVSGKSAREFQFQVIQILRADYAIVLVNEGETNLLFSNLKGNSRTRSIRLTASSAVSNRTAGERRRYREQRFRSYFDKARSLELDYSRFGLYGNLPLVHYPETWKNLLVALCDGEGFIIALAILEDIDLESKRMLVHTATSDTEDIRAVQFGFLHIDKSGRELTKDEVLSPDEKG